MQPAPAIPPFEPPPLPLHHGRFRPSHPLDRRPVSRDLCGHPARGRRCCSTRRRSSIGNPNAFITGTGLYFVFGLSSFWWVQQDRLPLPLPTMLFSLLAGDVFFLSLVMFAGGIVRRAAADPAVPAARGQRLDPAHADRILPRGVRLHLPARPRCVSRDPRHGDRPAGVPDRHHRLRLSSRPSASRSRSVATPSNRRTSPRSAASTSRTSSRSTASSSRTCRTACSSSTSTASCADTTRRSRACSADSAACAAACASRSSRPRCTITGGAGRRTSPRRCRRSRSRRRSACCACASCASARASTAARSSISRTSGARKPRRSR